MGCHQDSHPRNTGGRQGDEGTSHTPQSPVTWCVAGGAAHPRKHASAALTVRRGRSPARTGAEAFASLAPGRIPAGYGGEERKQEAPAPKRQVTALESLETAASRSAGISHTCGTKVTCAEGWDRVTPRGPGSSGRAPPSGDREEGGLVPYAASIRPVAGHAGGQQQGRHGLVEEEVVVDELLLLRFGHALERVIPA